MRTVHETEALRPSDPVPRNHSQAQVKPQRLKLIMSSKPPDAEKEIVLNDEPIVAVVPVSNDVEFDDEELALPSDHLYKLCRRQVHWAEQEGEKLRKECEDLEAEHKRDWLAKELLLANVMEAELATAVNAGPTDQEYDRINRMMDTMLPEKMLPMEGETPWYRVIPEPAEH